MTLEEIERAAMAADKPIVANMYQANGSLLIAIGMKGGVVLKEHRAPSKAKIMVIKGEIDFNTETQSLRLAAPDSLDIPLDVSHSVAAYNDTLFLLHLE